jgi:hypothetical protein
MIDTQLLNDVLVTLAFVVGLVIAISAWSWPRPRSTSGT